MPLGCLQGGYAALTRGFEDEDGWVATLGSRVIKKKKKVATRRGSYPERRRVVAGVVIHGEGAVGRQAGVLSGCGVARARRRLLRHRRRSVCSTTGYRSLSALNMSPPRNRCTFLLQGFMMWFYDWRRSHHCKAAFRLWGTRGAAVMGSSGEKRGGARTA